MLDGPASPSANRLGLGHLAFGVDDVFSVVDLLLANGGHMLGEVVVRVIPGVGELTFAYAADPEGNILEIQSWKKEKK